MIAITANTVKGIIAAVAAHIVRCVTLQSASAVHTSVPHVMNRSVRTVHPNARNAKKYFARTV